MRTPFKSGFTLIEILIVVAIVIIISSAAVGGSSNILKGLRFSNHFNQAIFMLEEARSLAASGKDVNAESYTVVFDTNVNAPKISVLKTKKDASIETIDTYSFLTTNKLILFSPACNSTVEILFTNQTAKTGIRCGNNVALPSVTVSVKESPSGRKKCFAVHQAAGIAQINSEGDSCP